MIRRNSWRLFIFLNRFHLIIRAFSIFVWNEIIFRLSFASSWLNFCSSSMLNKNFKNSCHDLLNSRYLSRLLLITLSCFIILRAYIILVTWDVWSTCLFAIRSSSFSFQFSSLSFSFLRNAFCFRTHRWLIAMLISRYDWIVNLTLISISLFSFKYLRICLNVNCRFCRSIDYKNVETFFFFHTTNFNRCWNDNINNK